MAFTIRRYADADSDALFALLCSEGENWGDYHRDGGSGWEKYTAALRTSIVYLLFEEEKLLGYVRARDDDGFGMYVYDLLVHGDARGKGCGRALLEKLREEAGGGAVYVMSDQDGYYNRLGYRRAGSIFVMGE